MSLMFIGTSGSFERRWIFYAMLRDNVQHHLEQGTPSRRFENLHALGEALFAREASVPATALHQELRQLDGLLEKPLSDFAVSVRTRAVQSMKFPLPDQRNTMLAAAGGFSPPIDTRGMKTLGDMFGSLVSELRGISEGAKEGDEIRVVDG